MDKDNVIHFDEIKIKKAIAKAETALVNARILIAQGIAIPPEILIRLETLILSLEEKLIKLIKRWGR